MSTKNDAIFIGYQECPGLTPIPLFNIIKRTHARVDSTVSALTLEKEGLTIPPFPGYTEWVRQRESKGEIQ